MKLTSLILISGLLVFAGCKDNSLEDKFKKAHEELEAEHLKMEKNMKGSM
ncbi:MAG: hypothetical protein IPG24_25365 [Leptospiraceae bacterium]|nr:hypothetical protein [Leptospiraceae bacterium]